MCPIFTDNSTLLGVFSLLLQTRSEPRELILFFKLYKGLCGSDSSLPVLSVWVTSPSTSLV